MLLSYKYHREICWFHHFMQIEVRTIERASNLSNQHYTTTNSNCRWDHGPNWCKYVPSSATASLWHPSSAMVSDEWVILFICMGQISFTFNQRHTAQPTKIINQTHKDNKSDDMFWKESKVLVIVVWVSEHILRFVLWKNVTKGNVHLGIYFSVSLNTQNSLQGNHLGCWVKSLIPEPQFQRFWAVGLS